MFYHNSRPVEGGADSVCIFPTIQWSIKIMEGLDIHGQIKAQKLNTQLYISFIGRLKEYLTVFWSIKQFLCCRLITIR